MITVNVRERLAARSVIDELTGRAPFNIATVGCDFVTLAGYETDHGLRFDRELIATRHRKSEHGSFFAYPPGEGWQLLSNRHERYAVWWRPYPRTRRSNGDSR